MASANASPLSTQPLRPAARSLQSPLAWCAMGSSVIGIAQRRHLAMILLLGTLLSRRQHSRPWLLDCNQRLSTQ